jgi:hypothetical protein
MPTPDTIYGYNMNRPPLAGCEAEAEACAWSGAGWCYAQHAQGGHCCTRPAGHVGAHVTGYPGSGTSAQALNPARRWIRQRWLDAPAPEPELTPGLPASLRNGETLIVSNASWDYVF